MAYLLSLGMTLTLLGVTGLIRHGGFAAALLLGLNAALAACSLNRRVALGGGCVALFTIGLWLFVGGAGILVECFRALSLHLSGLRTALPMVGLPFAAILCVLCAVAAWFVTQRSAGAYPALILLVMAVVLLWLGDRTDVLPCLLPAVIAAVTLLLRAGDEHTSTLRVLPLAVVVSGIAFAGMAAQGAVSEPLRQLAEDIRQRIYDTFFYTEPRDVFTLATEGYYPQGMNQLGGPAEPHDQPVMAVITPRKTYLRGVVKNVYTGRTWIESIGGRRYLWSASRFEELRSTVFDQRLPMQNAMADASLLTARRLQVRMLRDSASTLFVPQRLRQLQPEGSMIPYFNASSEVFATANLQAGDVWTVEAPLFSSADGGLEALVSAAETASDPNWSEVCDSYLQLHDDIDQRVYQLAAQATARAATPYAKAMALQQFLSGNYAYRLDVPPQPTNQDFVSTFLIETKEGYCTYFASAMTVMCRMVGLPARYVEGYVAYPDPEGLAVVTGQEGHAWTEVYFRGFGWVTFDATPISVDAWEAPPDAPSDGSDSTPEQTPAPTESPTSTPEPTTPPEDSPAPSPEPSDAPSEQPEPSALPDDPPSAPGQETPQASSGFPWRGLLIVLLLLLLLLRWVLVQPDVQSKRQKSEFRRWLVYTQATHEALRRLGCIRDAVETPAGFLRRAAGHAPGFAALHALAEAENLMFYGHAVPYETETAQARACFRAVYARLNAGQKLLFHLQRVFLPARVFDITRTDA
ncbi:MAG: transglutaminase domain-containing protein [Clostridiales bacterium]|nr:transglutaminase domain-containing protein [Clostridiales bacterium]